MATNGMFQPYVANDLHSKEHNDPHAENDIIYMIDVDYYLREDDFQMLAGSKSPIAMYTFSPVTPCGLDGDTSFTIVDDKVRYSVSGGGSWEHYVWDWCSPNEFITFDITHTSYRAFGNSYFGRFQQLLSLFTIHKFITYKTVHVRPFPSMPNRAIIWLLPQFSYSESVLLPNRISKQFLQRSTYVDINRCNWNRIDRQGANGLVTSIGMQGGDYSVTLPTKDLQILLTLDTPVSVTSKATIWDYNTRDVTAITQYYKNNSHQSQPWNIIGKSLVPSIFPFLPVGMEFEEPNWRSLSPPIISGSNLVPLIKREESMKSSLEYRVFKNVNKTIPNIRYSTYATEWLNLIVPESIAGTGIPYSLGECMAMLNKPTQIAAVKRIIETIDIEPRANIESFVKNEPTNKPNRIISSFGDTRYLLFLSSYTLRFRDEVLHPSPKINRWFSPGRTPNEIVQQVRDYVASLDDTPIEGDYSSFDGTVSAWLQTNVINAAYLRYYGFNEDLSKLLSGLISAPAKTKRFSFRYEAGPGIKSGSPTTCDGNSMLNGFLMYCAVRKTYPELTPSQAMDQIGLAFGDDSVFSAKYSRNFQRVAKEVGMELKAVKYDPEQGLTYLARVFIDPYTTDTTMQDPVRTLRKLHLTARNATVPLPDAALDRIEGFEVTDGITPIISDYILAVKRWYTPLANNKCVRDKRADKYVDKPYWLFEEGATKSWPQHVFDFDLMLAVFLNRTGVSLEIYEKMRDHIQATSQLEPSSLLTLNLDLELSTTYVGTVLPDANIGGPVTLNAQSQPNINNINNDNNNMESGPSPRTEVKPSSGLDTKLKSRPQQHRRNNRNVIPPVGGNSSSSHSRGFNRTQRHNGFSVGSGQKRQNNNKCPVVNSTEANHPGLDGHRLPGAPSRSRSNAKATNARK
jgi:hypothetical protein